MKRKHTDLERLLNALDKTKIEYAKANYESTHKVTGVKVYMTVIQNAFVFDRMTGVFLFTHHSNLMRPEPAPASQPTPDPARQ